MYGLPQGHSKLGEGGGKLSLVAYMERLHPKGYLFQPSGQEQGFHKRGSDICHLDIL